MNEQSQNTTADITAVAKVKESRTISKVWLVPIVAFFIGVWFIYFQWSNQGPIVTIEFESATGLEAGKTKIKSKDVDVGVVKTIELKEDLTGVLVTAEIFKAAENMLTKNTEFWIVTPRISLSGVEALNTLLSGPYINMEPSLQGDTQYEFIARGEPPVTTVGTPGLHITLNSNDKFAYKAGDAVIYKGLKVGEFESIYFNLEERVVYYNVFIEAPYHQLITKNTRFWDVSGIDFSASADGIEIKTGSLETLLTNGVTFGVPEGMSFGGRITDRDYFDIFPNYRAASDQRFKKAAKFALMIEDSVRGLKVGAPVEYRGLLVGQVTAITPESYSHSQRIILDSAYAIPVIIEIQPGRVQSPDTDEGVEFIKSQILHWINNGFRATLKTGNLLTGSLYVDLDVYPDLAGPTRIENYLEYPIIPTISGEFDQLTQKFNQLLNDINKIQFEQLGDNAEQLMEQMTQTARSFEATSESTTKLIEQFADQNMAQEINSTLEEVNQLLSSYQQGSITNTEMNKTMKSVQNLLTDMQPLMKQLNRAPNSLVFPLPENAEIEPKGKQ